jgi:hypothetical protein
MKLSRLSSFLNAFRHNIVGIGPINGDIPSHIAICLDEFKNSFKPKN